MSWRLSLRMPIAGSLQPVFRPVHPVLGRRYSSIPKVSDPLRILFCGSDEFSCTSLKALHAEHTRNAELIRSIDVVVRPGKPTGRGYKTIREAPLKKLAEELKLNIHERDTFTGWDMPEPTNLIIAVSFGLFVPPRLLRAAKYGGLNVHPSLLPDLRGPAPLQHALLSRRSHTGVSLQTLSDKTFDAGTVLSQTPLPGIPIPPNCTVQQLHDMLAPLGADMLVDGLRNGVHVPPHVDVGWSSNPLPTPPNGSPMPELKHAPKITPADRQLSWSTSSASSVALQSRVVGQLWTHALHKSGSGKRVILDSITEVVPPTQYPDHVIKSFARAIQQNQTDTLPDVKRVTWLQQPPFDKTLQQIRTPCFIDSDGQSILVPMPGGGGGGGGGLLRVGVIKVEGDKAKPAATAIQAFFYEGGSDVSSD